MAALDAVKPPIWFWIVALLALAWEVMGCFAYVSQVGMSAADIAKLPADQQEIWQMMPGWVTGAYAVAVWIGLLGAIALVARKSWARPLFIVSVVAAIAQFGWTFLATPILKTMGASAALFPAVIILIGLLLVGYAGHATRRGWLS
ncbi:hypothetical protein SAMN06295912_108162 [Sphingomonas laterariae]|uniref:Sugar transporter n=1 Tax=Edaphosphingomonas laterariae TaxID=861865 RepID=A0A239FBK5_9SPHN|nr:hypothetical protein [Sphingomonas laterariae]SNS54207.1 hypothetical protein SAMN06295912_108162 [Sphingomonas laterariae]